MYTVMITSSLVTCMVVNRAGQNRVPVCFDSESNTRLRVEHHDRCESSNMYLSWHHKDCTLHEANLSRCKTCFVVKGDQSMSVCAQVEVTQTEVGVGIRMSPRLVVSSCFTVC